MDYYFSRIQLFDETQIVTPSLKRKLDKKQSSKLQKLEKQGILVGKDSTRLLHKAKRMAILPTDEVPDVCQELRKKWKIATLKAQGIKVKDDLSLLKRSSDKVRKMKQKRRQKWEERKRHVEEMKKERQAIRQSNIQGRKNEKLARKYQKAKKKGRIFTIDQT
ncbi:unnamed protein product [Dicrocoelium dendriticum]|nr:unnamed protein product [Dicrocoelium dendriticum]